ncbi:MAG: TylF/MycF/NovP-related O-methyltransferase [Bacteroidota bacterium]
MKATITTKLKRFLSKTLPNSEKIRYLAALPKLNDFVKNASDTCKVFKTRKELYTYLNDEINNTAINYCEFGVYQGASIKYWSATNTDPKSDFHGFDTFTGLPETWSNFTGGLSKGVFDVKGQLPQIDDDRVFFHKGLFQDTLPSFIKNNELSNTLVINIDADLYSSTLFVLTQMDNLIKTGTIIIFDEFSSMLHEFRALEDYCMSYRREYEVLAATTSKYQYYAHVAIKIL